MFHIYFRLPGDKGHWQVWPAVDEADRRRIVINLLAAGYIVQN